jgi:hypothetical protein
MAPSTKGKLSSTLGSGGGLLVTWGTTYATVSSYKVFPRPLHFSDQVMTVTKLSRLQVKLSAARTDTAAPTSTLAS